MSELSLDPIRQEEESAWSGWRSTKDDPPPVTAESQQRVLIVRRFTPWSGGDKHHMLHLARVLYGNEYEVDYDNDTYVYSAREVILWQPLPLLPPGLRT